MQQIQIHEAGWLSPYALHAYYEGLAESLAPDDPPWLIMARSDRGHIALGASQYADAELNLAYCRMRRIPVVQRTLGGGTVWLDRQQLCLFFIFPFASAPRAHAALFDQCLGMLSEAYAHVGLTVQRRGGQDLWHEGRKLLGSGAATLGRSMVLGASVLEHFDAGQFAACIHSPSTGFSDWLDDALASGMTDLAALETAPQTDAFVAALYALCDARWGVETGSLTVLHQQAIAEAEHRLRQPLDSGGRRQVRGGIKINRDLYLLEDSASPWIRLLWHSGCLSRVASADRGIEAVLAACLERPLDGMTLHHQARAHGFSEASALALVNRIEQLCASLQRDA